MKVRFIDYVGNPGGGIMVGTNLFLALQRLHPEVQFEFVSYGPAFMRYRRAFAEQKAQIALRVIAPPVYWRNALTSMAHRLGFLHVLPGFERFMQWHFETPLAVIGDCDALVFPWAHRHVPPHDQVRAVANMMDITCLRTAQMNRDPIAQSWRENKLRNLKAWLASNHRLTAISQTTIRHIVQHTGVASERIRAIPIVGKDISAAPPWPAEWTWGTAPFIVYPSNLSPHKNHEALFKAFQLAQSSHTLVLSGSGACLRTGPARRLMGRQQALADYAQSCGLVLGRTLISLGYIPEIRYQALLSRAHALIMPSLMEGYGLPVDEALRAGIPVLCSDIPVFCEVVKLSGGEVLWFDPKNPADIARALLLLRDNYAEFKRRAGEQAVAACRRTWLDVAALYWSLLNGNK